MHTALKRASVSLIHHTSRLCKANTSFISRDDRTMQISLLFAIFEWHTQHILEEERLWLQATSTFPSIRPTYPADFQLHEDFDSSDTLQLLRRGYCAAKPSCLVLDLIGARMLKRIADHCGVRWTNHRYIVGMPPTFSPGLINSLKSKPCAALNRTHK